MPVGQGGERSLEDKRKRLLQSLEKTGSLLIAFSGGVDSTLLLAVAHEVLGAQVLAVTACSPIHPSGETRRAERFARKRRIEHLVVPSEEMSLPAFTANGPDRCYHCKRALFQQLTRLTAEKGLARVAHGANVDDLSDYRPGTRVAREAGVWAPLEDAGFRKDEIRELSRKIGLSCWDQPAGACLATRIPYGQVITAEKLHMIEQAERILEGQGIRSCRVRHHGTVAKIEVDRQGGGRIMEDGVTEAVVAGLREVGFLHVALDLEPYASGRLNRALTAPDGAPCVRPRLTKEGKEPPR